MGVHLGYPAQFQLNDEVRERGSFSQGLSVIGWPRIAVRATCTDPFTRGALAPMHSVVGIEQASTRVREIQTMVDAMATGARPGAVTPAVPDPAFAAALQGQLGTAGATDPATGLPTTLDPAMLAKLSGQSSSALGIQSMLAGAMPTFGATATGAPSKLTGDLDGLDPQLRASLEQVAATLGQPIEIKSGLRTHAEQEELYRRYLAGTGNLAAPPGSSNHESGRAVDAYVGGVALADVEGGRAAAAAAGLGFPVGGEPWHVEPIR